MILDKLAEFTRRRVTGIDELAEFTKKQLTEIRQINRLYPAQVQGFFDINRTLAQGLEINRRGGGRRQSWVDGEGGGVSQNSIYVEKL